VIIAEDGAPLYVVERICEWLRVGKTNHMQYLIKWQGYKESENTWEPRRNLIGMAGSGGAGRDGFISSMRQLGGICVYLY
jgi:hypothetical protein